MYVCMSQMLIEYNMFYEHQVKHYKMSPFLFIISICWILNEGDNLFKYKSIVLCKHLKYIRDMRCSKARHYYFVKHDKVKLKHDKI